MDMEDQERIFKKFQTGKIFLKSKEYGSGLGLYISRLLANSMGMTLVLEKSEVGKGSTFSLTIPLFVA
jgi:signal transduction histidine kinase